MLSAGSFVSLWDMLELNAERYSRALMNFTMMRQLLLTANTMLNGNGLLGENSVKGVLTNLDSMERELETLDANFTIMAIRDLRSIIESGQNRAAILSARASEIERRLEDELKSTVMFIVNKKDAEFYEGSRQCLGHVAEQSFPTAIFDIEEAGKCMGLGRYTACVFHVMRAGEAAVIELARSLSATVTNKHGEVLPWGVLAANIGRKIEAMDQNSTKDDWHQVHMFLVSCNRAFRTKTAHPVETYTMEQAKEAFDATLSFIKSVARMI